jgi:asparagine synthase (glutamine-hydrolysing)
VLGYTQPKFLAKIQKMRGKHFHNQQSDTFANFNKYTTHLIRRSIEPQLRWQDRASMAFSIESRQPFLDYRMVEALLNLPLEQKFNKGTTKVLLREAMHNILPDKVKNRTSKFGFPSPQKSLLNNIEPTFYQKYAKIGINIIKDMSVKYKNITPLQESCLNFTTGLWAEMFGVTG